MLQPSLLFSILSMGWGFKALGLSLLNWVGGKSPRERGWSADLMTFSRHFKLREFGVVIFHFAEVLKC